MTLGRIATTLGAGAAALALTALTWAGSAAADPSGYPGGGYPGGYGSGGNPGGGISTTTPTPGGPITVTAACSSGTSASLSFDGSPIVSSPVSNGTARLTGTIPAGSTGAHTIVATCSDGQTYSFAVNVESTASAGGSLAYTGVQIATFSGAGVALLGGGIALVVLARRRGRTAA